MTSLAGKEVALAGRLFSMTRVEAVRRILREGGRHVREPGPSTSLLVAGGAHGHLTPQGEVPRTLRLFRKLKEQGAGIRLVDEPEFLGMLGDEEDLTDFSRLYTAEQVSRIAEVPLSEVRAWVRKGLLQPARMTGRLAWFDFTDILTARNLSRLASSGVPVSRIHRSLSDIAQWLPGGVQLLGRLEAYAEGLRVRLPDGGWAEPSGQRLMDFLSDRPPSAQVSRFPTGCSAPPGWFALAVAAEEQGDLESAAAGYTRALEESPDADAFFNLGNVLYELGREAEAADRYLQAIEADKTFAEAWNNLGNALVTLGKLEDAVHAYEMALSLEPDYPDPHCNLSTVLARLNRQVDALSHGAFCRHAFPSERRLTVLRRPLPEGE